MIEEIQGNLLDTDCKLIAHGVNCQGKMGSGVAKALYTKWPGVKEKYLKVTDEFLGHYNPDDLLGHNSYVVVGDKVIANCFTQQNYGYDGQIYLSYKAMVGCMKALRAYMEGARLTEVAIPKIGCGLAGGDWEKVRDIIETVFPRKWKIKVYYLNK